MISYKCVLAAAAVKRGLDDLVQTNFPYRLLEDDLTISQCLSRAEALE
jgi:hypothetical protein